MARSKSDSRNSQASTVTIGKGHADTFRNVQVPDLRERTLLIDDRKAGTLDGKTRPRRRTAKAIGAYRVQKARTCPQTKGLSRFRA